MTVTLLLHLPHCNRNKLKVQYFVSWKKNMLDNPNILQEGSGKLSFYKKIKTKFRMDKYLQVINDGNVRKSVTKFRISAHKFPIECEICWKLRMPRELRTCGICLTQTLFISLRFIQVHHCLTIYDYDFRMKAIF